MLRIEKIGNTCGNSVGLVSWVLTAAIKSIAVVQQFPLKPVGCGGLLSLS